MIRPLITVGLLLLLCNVSVHAQETAFARGNPNQLILALIDRMPQGGCYLATSNATRDLQSAVQVSGGKLSVQPAAARGTYCSGATYLVFVQAIQRLLPAARV